MSKVVGITGTIGSGKSAVGKLLDSLGVPVIDTDKIVHELLFNDTESRKKVIELFGREIIDDTAGGAVDRTKLGALVFQNTELRKKLEAVLHPAVIAECNKRIADQADKDVVAVLVPLLFEVNLANKYDEIWVVTCDEKTIRKRLKSRDGLSDSEIDSRFSAQLSQAEKASRADYIIDNSSTLLETERQLLPLLHKHIR